jgi:predicted ATPase/DNA-binding winged helix-turn-helix (wHTH) protein
MATRGADGIDGSEVFEFGRFRVLPYRREVLLDGRPLDLGGRAFDLLVSLIEARGAVISKDDLKERVWPGRIVEENALQAHISALRKAFADDRGLIRTVAGRGYQFIGEIRASTPVADRRPTPTNVPERMSELIGRDSSISALLELTAKYRLVTLTGTGGVGKTRLALEVARHLLPRFPDGVWLAQLAPISDPELLPSVVASALGLTPAGGQEAIERVSAAVGARRALLILDSCEHVIESATRMAEGLLRASSSLRIIATSQVPLHAEGESVYRVPSLEVPPETTSEIGVAEQWGAVSLFVARAREAAPQFSLDKSTSGKVAAICRRLDGIPLAIELAAKHTGALGVDALAARLDDRFGLLAGGKRTALPRQQTLRATLDWSYDLLPDAERAVLRRLTVFAGVFSLPVASAVAAGDGVGATDFVNCFVRLIDKSLVTPISADANAGYRLLETTRAYALEKLIASGEFARCARRHAEHYDAVFQQAEAQWDTEPSDTWLARYRPCLDNVRVALDWAFSPEGDAAMGIALTVAAVPLWFQLSLVDECLSRVERALSSLADGVAAGDRHAMHLHAAHGWSLMYTAGPARETGAAWTTALALAQRLNNVDYEMRALWGLWAGHVNNGEFQDALALAERFSAVAAKSTEPADLLVGERMMGVARHFLGDQSAARQHIERTLSQYVTPSKRSHIVRFQFDQRVTARITHSRILWLQGLPDQAMRTIEGAVEDALLLNHSLSIGNMLAQAACPIAFLCGDLEAADRFLAIFLDRTSRRALDAWHTYGRCFSGMLLIRRGDLRRGLQLLRNGVDELRGIKFTQYQTAFLFALAEGLAAAGQVDEGLVAIDEALDRSERAAERWCLPELLRIKGELELKRRVEDADAAQRHFKQSLEWARRQGALSWELRTSTSLARLWLDQGLGADAHALLVSVRARFTEGFATADLMSANQLLDLLTAAGCALPQPFRD